MYVREKKIRRGEKSYSYWQLVSSNWTPDGPRQRVVAHLGRAANRADADVLARASGLLCGASGCSKPATVPLTWRGWEPGHEKPVETTEPFNGRIRGFMVCPDHLEEWHHGQATHLSQGPPFRVGPGIFPRERVGHLAS